MTSAYGFPRTARILRRSEFDRVFAKPKTRMRQGPLRLLAVPNRMRGARLGLVVPKRILKRAVDRNRTKREIRESFRLARPTLPAWDIVVVLTARGDVRDSAEELWERALGKGARGGTPRHEDSRTAPRTRTQ